MDLLFYECQVCGNVILKVLDSGQVPRCCGRPMEILEPGIEGGSKDHHIPVAREHDECLRVFIGEEEHPMEEAHRIVWVALKTTKGVQIEELEPGEKPVACFCVSKDEEPEAVYAYCNVHKLWKAEI